ncbi:hypothetical protein SO802_034003 [Lithocarpus litseifolius]|uniref:Uncharacterized protein n=1 Tax=Lithocarpus litseifolius TaxID=425828 RepID=A0AAW2BGD9_9ROSI
MTASTVAPALHGSWTPPLALTHRHRKLLLKFGFLSKKTGASRAEIIVPTGLPNALVVFAHNDLLCGTLMVNYEEGSFGVIGLGVGVSLLS